MKKQLLMLICMLISGVSFAQYSLTGYVMTGASVPVVGQTVYVQIDTLLNPPSTTYWSNSTTTNSSGAYSFTLPSTTATGTYIRITTANCSGPDLMNTPVYAGINLTSDFKKCAPGTTSLTGLVTLGGTSTGAANAKVFIIDIDTTTTTPVLTLVDTTLTNAFGNYTATFPVLSGGHRILVKAALLPSSSVYSSYLPTYSYTSLMWYGATSYPISPSSGAQVELQAGTNPGGPGFVGGSVLLGANKTTAVGDPLPGRQIMLTNNSNVPVAYTYSDASGAFSFPSLAYGTYKIFGDVLGKTSAPLTITLSASNKTINNVLFQERSKTFNAELTATSVNDVTGSFAALVIYPNPAKDQLSITGISNGTIIKIYDVYGRQVYSDIAKQSTGNINITYINIAHFANGTYVLQLTDADGNQCSKWVIKE